MSGGYIMNRLREELSSRCAIVWGFPPATLPQNVCSLFQCQRAEPAGGGSTWLLLFQNSQLAKWWVTSCSTCQIGDIRLHILASSESDIPDAWLQDDQHGSAGAPIPGYPTTGFHGFPRYHGHGVPGSIPSSLQSNPYNQNISGSSQPFQCPSATPMIASPGCLQSKIFPGSEPQVVRSDPKSSKSSMDPTVYPNFPSMTMPIPEGAMAPPSYESHNFPPKVPPRPSTMKSFQSTQGEYSHEQASVHQSLDTDPVRATVQDYIVMARTQAQDVIRCQYCEDEPAVFHCVPCGDELCPRCKVFHLKSKVPSGHNIILLSERLHPANLVKMCEIHSSKAYEACCEDCQVPVCITCIQEVHNKHSIGKIQDLYEKQKAETEDELSKMKVQWKSEIIQRINDFKKGEKEMKTGHENIREKMKKQAQDFIEHIRAILKEALHNSEKEERKNLDEISRHKAEAERFEQNLDQLIEKFETLTESSHPAELILYRKQNLDIFKRLKFPHKVGIVLPSFTVGQFNKSQNEQQFGKFTTGQVSHLKSRDDTLQPTQPTLSATKQLSTKNILGRSVKVSEMKTKKKNLFHVSCLNDRSAYISGDDSGILLIDRSGTQLDNISTDRKPFGLALMKDGSLIYSDYSNKVIYRVSLNKQKTKLINTECGPEGLCCTRSGDILLCMGLVDTARVVKYSSSGREIQEFLTDQNGKRLFINPLFVCENVNGDICVSDLNSVRVLKNSGNPRFTCDENVLARTLRREFNPRGVATDSLGHILIADWANNAVHLISQDGDFLSYILTKDDGISQPYGISVDTSDNLWLVEGKTACVKVYQYLS